MDNSYWQLLLSILHPLRKVFRSFSLFLSLSCFTSHPLKNLAKKHKHKNEVKFCIEQPFHICLFLPLTWERSISICFPSTIFNHLIHNKSWAYQKLGRVSVLKVMTNGQMALSSCFTDGPFQQVGRIFCFEIWPFLPINLAFFANKFFFLINLARGSRTIEKQWWVPKSPYAKKVNV